MLRERCSVHGLLLSTDGTCARCRRASDTRGSHRVYLAVVAVAAGVLGLMFWAAPQRRVSPPSTSVATADRTEAPSAEANDVAVTLYSASYCGWCRKTKSWLDGHGVAYTERRVDEDDAAKAEMVRKFGKTGIPAIDVGGALHSGYDPDWLDRTISTRRARRL